MEFNKSAGLISIIIGLIFIIFPMFSAELISIIVGLSLLVFGISSLFMGFNIRNDINKLPSTLSIILGILAIIIGFMFIFYIDALSFLVGLQFYIIGFIMILLGITGVIARINTASTITSIFVALLGIVSIFLAIFALNQPVYIAIIIGVVLIIEGITFFFIQDQDLANY